MSAEDTAAGHVDLILQVFDTGIGISKEDQKYLFDPFRRVNEKQNATIQGTGLGLSITKELLSLMKGSISVDSDPGHGSCFKIILPQSIKDPSPIGPFSVEKKPVERNSYRESFRAPEAKILIVDDVSVNLKVIEGLLKNTQIQIDKAGSGDEAIRLCTEKHYDVILMDHSTPEIEVIPSQKGSSCENRFKVRALQNPCSCFKIHRFAVIIPLGVGAAEANQKLPLLLRFDSLCNDFHVKTLRNIYNALDEDLRFLIL